MNVLSATQRSERDARAAHRESLLQAWGAVFGHKTVVYLSGPITTGDRFVNWYRKTGRSLPENGQEYRSSLAENVIRPNERDLQDAAAKMRRDFGLAVLEPASITVSGWSQSDYIALWVAVVERLAGKVVMMPGWQFSEGCAAEIAQAFRSDVPVEKVDSQTITLQYALAALREAAAEMRRDDIPFADGIARAAEQLQQLRPRVGG